MTTPLPLESLATFVSAEIAAASPGAVAVLAGHYAIFSSGGKAVDLLDPGARAPAGAAEMLAFTRFTWTAACEAVTEAPRARMLVLVDDIQFVRPAIDARDEAERLGAALADGYLAKTRTLPDFHLREMRQRGVADVQVLRRENTRWVFSERELRIAAVQRLRRQLDESTDGATGLSANADQSRIDVMLPEHGEYCLVHSGRTNCAGGYLELLAEVHRRGVQTLIAMVPMCCRGPVSVGTAVARRLGLGRLTVVTIAIPDVESGVSATVSRSAS